MKFNFYNNEYSSSRNVVFGSKGMVASSNVLATEAGIEILKKGGNAIDSAIATAAALTVVEPTSNGLGGDAFAIVYFDNKLHHFLHNNNYLRLHLRKEKLHLPRLLKIQRALHLWHLTRKKLEPADS